MGTISYKKMTPFGRILFYQVVSWVIIYGLSNYITKYQKWHNLPRNNHWLFNINILIECSFLTFAAYYYLKKTNRSGVLFLYGFFFISYILIMYFKSFSEFNPYAYLFECLLVTALYSLVLYNYFNSDLQHQSQPIVVWVSIGILLYFACNVPYFSLFDYLNRQHPEISSKLFAFITDILANARYLCLAIGFWLIRRHPPLSSHPTAHAR